MAFKNEERKSNIISGSDIFRKVVDERFENLINEIKTAGIEGRTNAGKNSFAQLIQQFQYIWDDNESAFIQPLVAFVNIATQIGCYGCDNVTPARKEEVANYFQDLEAFKNLVIQREDFFDYKDLTDENYQLMINVFLSASLEPLTSGYPDILFAYMICVACADTYNEKGIALIKKLRDEYFEFAPLRKDGKIEEFTGTIK